MEAIERFLHRSVRYDFDDSDGFGSKKGSGNGSGYGTGHGSSYGDGDGSGYGFTLCFGYNNGTGYGYGHGSGEGCSSVGGFSGNLSYNIKFINCDKVYTIDRVQTIIQSVRDNIAKGFILNSDLTTTPCYIVKEDDQFAHGSTLKDAMTSLQDKLFRSLSVQERIDKFKETFIDYNKKYSAKLLFEWHHRLTRSCLLGRQQWVKDRDINLDTDTFTIHEFIELTKDSYGVEVIRQL